MTRMIPFIASSAKAFIFCASQGLKFGFFQSGGFAVPFTSRPCASTPRVVNLCSGSSKMIFPFTGSRNGMPTRFQARSLDEKSGIPEGVSAGAAEAIAAAQAAIARPATDA